MKITKVEEAVQYLTELKETDFLYNKNQFK